MFERSLRKLLPFDADVLLAKAARRAGHDDFAADIHAPLQILLRSLTQQADLKPIGHVVAFNDLLALLVNHLQLRSDRRQWPDIAGTSIARPVFITGLPRTGTTLLHALLAGDERLRAPLAWEVMSPSPPAAVSSSRDLQRRRLQARSKLRWLDRLAPGFQAIHEVGAELPQECIAITAQSLLSLRFLVTYRLPDYADHLAQADMRPAYRWHRGFLQQLQYGQTPLRWVLKAPGHLGDLDALLAQYPDAVVIQTHRDPLKTIPSLASLRMNMRRAFARTPDAGEIGAEVSAYWQHALQRCQQVRETSGAEHFVDVCYDGLLQAPAATLAAVYAKIGLHWRASDAQRLQQYLLANPQGKHGRHSYQADEFGLSESGLRQQFSDYRLQQGWA
ncbi:MAG: sulfotransferase [Gammaproteobacteria bacterium]|nr:sulfotransferase [Gammaproteobacteria bacterium]